MIQFTAPKGGQVYLSSSWVVHTDGQTLWGYVLPAQSKLVNGQPLELSTIRSFGADTRFSNGDQIGIEKHIHHLHANGEVSFVNTVSDFVADFRIASYPGFKVWIDREKDPSIVCVLPPYLFGDYDATFNFPGYRSYAKTSNDNLLMCYGTDNPNLGDMTGIIPGLFSRLAYSEKTGATVVFCGTVLLLGLNGSRMNVPIWAHRVVTASHTTQEAGLGLMVDPFISATHGWLNGLEHDTNVDTFDLVRECYESMNYFTSNGIAFAKDLAEFRKLIPKAKDLLNLKKPKSWASLYLWAHYGLSLTISDSKDLVQAFKEFANANHSVANLKTQVRYASTSKSSAWGPLTKVTRYTVKLDCMPRDVGKDLLMGELFDTNLSLGNVWDLIPFSFVVDWFADISSKLDRIDTYVESNAYYRLNCLTYGVRTTCVVSASQIMPGASGSVSLVRYDRTPSATFPPFRFPSTQSPQLQKHFIEAAALIVSATK